MAHIAYRSKLLSAALAFLLAVPASVPANDAMRGEDFSVQSIDESKLSTIRQSLYTDIFDQAFYEEGVRFLRLGDVYRWITRKKQRAWDVNIYDEVPDSLVFTNRHGRQPLSTAELKKGPGLQPPAGGKFTVVRGKVAGVNPGFFIRDSAQKEFLLKFDPVDYPELASAAESVASRIFHAIGYNVPSYHIYRFGVNDFDVDPKARYYDASGFRKPLTKQKVEELLFFAAKTSDEKYRSSASALLEGQILGAFGIDGRRSGDPNDPVAHENLRAVRALRVFGSWINYYDLLTSQTMDVLEDKDGKKVVRHYILDFGSSLGSSGYDAKPPHFGHEYVFDWAEVTKSVLSLGFYKRPWQKRWEENKKQIEIPSIGYFDNKHFDPGKWKSQVPYRAFRNLTDADGYWAAKIIMSFSDDDIRALVESGELTSDKARAFLAATLSERRDIIGRYWFSKSVPLDWFKVSPAGGGLDLGFTDLMKHYNLDDTSANYRYEVLKTDISGESASPSVSLDSAAASRLGNGFILALSVKRGSGSWSKKVHLTFQRKERGYELTRISRES